jgi:RNA polymerase-associated protein CTR9
MALMAIKLKNYELAHSLTKEALTSQPGNTELRALYTHFLIETNSIKAAREFTAATLKEYNSNDVHAMCAFAMVTYILARENKDQSKEGQKDRAGKFKGAAQIFDKALDIDPYCAYAAQGLAISIAEGTIGAGATVDDATGQPLSESAQRARNSRDALSILMKVKESLADGSVHVNIGHCHFAREEWEKAIQNVRCSLFYQICLPLISCLLVTQYETASQRFYEGKNVPTLLYLARSWYHKANKDHNFADLRQSLITLKAVSSLLLVHEP